VVINVGCTFSPEGARCPFQAGGRDAPIFILFTLKLLDDLKDRRGYSHLKEEALDRTMRRSRFGGGLGLVVRLESEMNEY